MLNNSAMDSVASVAGNSNDFKNLTSLGEVQRIIGLSLSKIQLGRNQRGGLPLHKNLLVATVLNKARDLYMQETMYMNYKMMVNGQFAAAAASASNHHQGVSAASNMMQAAAAAGVHQSPYGSPHGYHYQGANHSNACDQEDLEPQTEANEADYDEDSESDVEDECDQPIVSNSAHHANNIVVNNNLRSSMVVGAQANLAAYSAMQQQHHNNQILQSPGGGNGMANSLHSMPLQPNNINNNKPVAGNSNAVQQHHHQQQNSDEGFIEDPDCDCDARNYGTSESRVPFQYCYHCAPFHPSNGRGPTLVPSPSCPSSPGPSSGSGGSSVTSSAVSSTATTSLMLSSSSTVTSSTMTSSSSATTTTTTTLYDMDAQVTHAGQLSPPSRGTKRCRSLSLDTTEDDDENDILDESTKKKRRESSEDSSSSPDTSLEDESGYQSDSSQHEMFHPAFRGATSTPTSETCSVPGGPGSGGQTMEIDQITSLVSIFSFGQQIMAAAAAANKSTRTSPTSGVGNTVVVGSPSSPPPPQGGQDLEDAEDKKGEAGGGGPSSEDSDSESDTSSDSGHSSDDHEAAKEAEELSSVVVSQPPDLCTTTVPLAVASEALPCVEVASL